MTLEALAEAAGTSLQQLSRLEKGQRKLTQDWMMKIAGALHVTPAALLGHDATGAPQQGRFVDEPQELAILALWDAVPKAERERVMRMIRAAALDPPEVG